MADYSTSLSYPIGATDPLAEQIWSAKTHTETAWETWWAKKGMVAEDKGDEESHKKVAGSPVVMKSEFGSKAGQRLNMSLRRQLTRTPRTATNGIYTYGSTVAVGYEEAMVYMDIAIWLDKLKHMVGFDAPDIFQHRTSIDLESDVRQGLKEWLVENLEEIYIDGLIDGSAYMAIQDALTSAVAHPNLYYVEGASSLITTDSTKVMTARELRRINSFFARVNGAGLNPIPLDGSKCGLMLCSTYIINQLFNDEEFRQIVSQGDVRGNENRMISGSIGKFGPLYIHAYERARVAAGSDAVEEVFIIGANALAVGYGSEPRFLVRHEDAYGDRWGRGIAQIVGIARADWQNAANTVTLNQSSGNWRVYRGAESWG